MKKTLLLLFVFPLAFSALAQDSSGRTRIRFDKAGTLPVVQPLVLVDGRETDMQSMVLSPNSIERIDVLKNKATTVTYGDKGKDGVILITTKQGTEFYTLTDFVNAEKNASVKQVELNGKLLPDMHKLLIEKKSFSSTSISANMQLDEANCKMVSHNTIVITTNQTAH